MDNVKAYLQQFKKANLLINRTEEYIKKLEDAATSITASGDDERVQSSSNIDKTGELVARICDLKNKKQKQMEKAAEIMMEIDDTIAKLSDEKQRNVIQSRYILLETWAEIAKKLNYSERYILKIHGHALLKVKEILEKKEKDSK